ncbi:MAG: protein kinase, partial [Kofleriaceae bacterium]
MTSTTTERVGRYQLLEPIGLGPSGSVSRAKVFGVAGFERQFAIKRFHPELTSTTALAQALSAAARAYGGLEHPRIARMSEFGVAQGTTFTAVEFVAGLDALRLNSEARLAGTTLAAGGALALVSQAARAVGYAHGRGLTHLGLAPTNVMVTSEGDVKITDFGILSATLPPRPIDVARLANRIPYLAPEQLANEATSAATDVFALGVLAYELVTGARAFRGETPQQIAQAIQAGPPAEPPLPRPIVRVLQRCLARSPFERFPDARALADALDAALRVAPVPGTRKDIGAQVKAAMERIAALHESELSGVLPLDLGTGPGPRLAPPAARAASDEPGPSVIDLLRDSPATTMQDLPKPMTTVAGLAPPPIPVPPGLAPPPIPPPPAQPAAATTLLGISTGKPPPIPSIKSPATVPPTVPPSIPPARPAPVRMSEAAPGAAPVPTLRPATVGGIPPVPPVRPRTELPAEPARAKTELPAEAAGPRPHPSAEPARAKAELSAEPGARPQLSAEPAGARPHSSAEPAATSELPAKPGRARTDRPAEPTPTRTDHPGEAARARTELPVERARTESPVEPPPRPRAEPPPRPRTEPPPRPGTDLAIPTEPARPSADNEITLRGDELRAELVEPAMRPSTPPPPSAPIYELSPPSELPRDLRTTEMPPLLVERLNEATTRATSEIPSVDYLHPPATQPEISFEAPQDDDARATAFPSGTSHELSTGASHDASAAPFARSGPSSARSSGSAAARSGADAKLPGAALSGADAKLSGAQLSGAGPALSGPDAASSDAALSGPDAALSGAALSGAGAALPGAAVSGPNAALSGAAVSGADAKL